MGTKTGGSITSRDGPGPGAYGIKTVFSAITGPATFGSHKRFKGLYQTGGDGSKSMSQIPGPGAYEDKYKAKTRNAPNSVFGSANRDKNTFYDSMAKFNPGPGAYDQRNVVGEEGKSVTMSPRRPDTSPQRGKDTPGPGAYD